MSACRADSASSLARRGPGPVVCVGIDLAGVEHRETGVAVLRDGRLERLTTAASDPEVVAMARLAGRRGTVAINAPLTRPLGRCCLDDDCRCRHDPGTRSRQLERELARLGVPTLATALLKVLARRGRRIALALRLAGFDPLEVYPFATLRLLGLPTAGKKTVAGRRRIQRSLRRLVPGLYHPGATEHQLDAVVCALTAHLWRQGRARPVGRPDEGLMIVPDADACRDLDGLPRRSVAPSKHLTYPNNNLDRHRSCTVVRGARPGRGVDARRVANPRGEPA